MRLATMVCVAIMMFGHIALADSLSHLRGRVLDRDSGHGVEGAAVYIDGGAVAKTVTTDRDGRFAIILGAGQYRITIAHGASRAMSAVEMDGRADRAFEARIKSDVGELIVIRDRVAPAVPPKPTNTPPKRAPPYSERAVLSDAWTKAHLLLEVSEQGVVRRFKWLQRPGYDLEAIAEAEVRRLTFEPARDANGRAISVVLPWSIEWPSAWWLEKMVGTRSGYGDQTGLPPRPKWHYVPCKGSGPLNLGSMHPVYRDCSQPDLSRADREPWVAR